MSRRDALGMTRRQRALRHSLVAAINDWAEKEVASEMVGRGHRKTSALAYIRKLKAARASRDRLDGIILKIIALTPERAS